MTVEQPRWNNRAGTSTINTREQPLRNIHINYAGTASLEHPRWNSVRRNTHSGTAKKNAVEQRKSSLFHFQSSLFQRVFYGWTRDGWTSARCSSARLSLFQGKFVAVPEHLHQCDGLGRPGWFCGCWVFGHHVGFMIDCLFPEWLTYAYNKYIFICIGFCKSYFSFCKSWNKLKFSEIPFKKKSTQ